MSHKFHLSAKTLVVAAFSLLSATSYAATATATASANVLTPLSITEDVSMNFGDVAGDANSATTVVLDNAGSASSADGAYVVNNGSAAQFTVSGAANATYALTLPASITLSGPGADMTVDTLTHNSTGNLGAGGSEAFNVGGTLHINANQTAGSYSGSYIVTADYN